MCDYLSFIKATNAKNEEVVFGGLYGVISFPSYGKVEIEPFSRWTWRHASRFFPQTKGGFFGPYRSVTGENVVIAIKGEHAFIFLKDSEGKTIELVKMHKGARILRAICISGPCPECKGNT